MTQLETPRLLLRPVAANDLDDLAPILADPVVMKYLGIEAGTTLSRSETEIAIAGMIGRWAERGFGRWSVIHKKDGKLIGLCGFKVLEGEPELIYLFAKEYWGNGFATEAASASLRYGLDELKFERIVAAARPANIVSIRVLEKIGMKYQGEIHLSGVALAWYVAVRSQFTPGS